MLKLIAGIVIGIILMFHWQEETMTFINNVKKNSVRYLPGEDVDIDQVSVDVMQSLEEFSEIVSEKMHAFHASESDTPNWKDLHERLIKNESDNVQP